MNSNPVIPEHFRREFPYLNDVKADHRLLGYPAILNPLVQNVSSSRLDMFSSHRNQALVINKAELPDILSGYEKEDGKYTFNSTRRDQDIVVLKVIDRYASADGINAQHTPYKTVIYRGLTDNRIGYFNIDRFFTGSDGFGFQYDWHTVSQLETGDEVYVAKEEVIACSPNVKGSSYGPGVNIPTAFLSTHECIEDAMWISESAAEWMGSDELKRIVIDIPQDVRPINLYGSDYRIKPFPDIGQYVNDDGFLFACRNVSTTTCAADTSPDLMSEVNVLTDEVVVVRPGSQVVNIEFITNRLRNNPAYEQVETYHKATLDYYRAVYEFYHEHVRQKYQLTPTFNTLLTKAITQLVGAGQKIQGYADNIKGRTEFEGVNRQPVEFIQAIITVRRRRKVGIGHKISDVSGGFAYANAKPGRDESLG